MAGNGRPSFNISGKQQQHGAVAVVVAITLTGMMAMMGMAMDTGNILVERDKLQNMANAAALSAAKTYFFPNARYNDAKSNAQTTIESMGATTETLDIITPPINENTDINGRVIANVSKTISPLMLGMVGIGDTTLSATAVAGPAPEPAYSVAPIMACTNDLGDPGPVDTKEPKIYHFLESFLGDTDLNNVLGFRMFIDTTGFDNQILNKQLLYEVTSIMLASGDSVLMYEDTPTRIVDEYGVDLPSFRPGTMLNTRFGVDVYGIASLFFNRGTFKADTNSTFATTNSEPCFDNCNIREAFTNEFRQRANNEGLVTEFVNASETQSKLPEDYPYIYADYRQDVINNNENCPNNNCEPSRRIMKMPVAPNCAVKDLKQKQFACFFLLEPANVFIDNILQEKNEGTSSEGDFDWDAIFDGIDFEFRTEFIAQHIPCPGSTESNNINSAYDIVLYDTGNEVL